VFKDIDLDNDGVIQITEFEALCLKLGIRHVNIKDVRIVVVVVAAVVAVVVVAAVVAVG
jgi:hypothetical protein